MRIRSVTAHAFGPLVGETLELGDGMTVIVGGNESGKSSWHAAIYAALCGRRRGKGAARKDEARFVDLHRPWDREEWLVTAEVLLDDGRRVELRHDLANKVDCHAKDLVLGDDISAEVMNDGAPDGARWLGLDRGSFAATACVEQAHMLRVLTEADGLQEHLQRAAATAGTDATAAAALARLDAFKRDRVGSDRANSSKPLRRVLSAQQEAEATLDTTQAEHEDYLSRLEQVQALQELASAAEQAVAQHEAAVASEDATRWADLIRETDSLQTRLGGTSASTVAADNQAANTAYKALAAWCGLPTPAAKPSRSSAELDTELAALPIEAEGDTAVHDSVRRAEQRVVQAETRLDQHDQNRPAHDETPVPSVAVGGDELLDLARILETPLQAVPPEPLDERAPSAAPAPPKASPRRLSARLAVAGAALVIPAAAAVAIGLVVLGLALAVICALLGTAALLRRPPAKEQVQVVTPAARRETDADAAKREQAKAQQQRHDRAVARCAELGLPEDPDAVRAVPVARAREQAHTAETRRWTEECESLATGLAAATGELAGALAARGHVAEETTPAELRGHAEAYREACEVRASQAAATARRPDLIQQRDAALAAEQRADDDARARAAAAEVLLATAKQCGLDAATPDLAATALTEWESERANRLTQLAADQQDWARLQALLDGRTLEDLRGLAAAAADKAASLHGVASTDPVAPLDAAPGDRLPHLRAEATTASSQAAAANGELRQFAASLRSVAEAEETLAQTTRELERLRELEATLDVTTKFLSAAQERVHRDIAPLLANTVRAWLPNVTAGRYSDVIVNPTSLQVEVAGASGKWRQADRLSHGTSEQIYLLLRVALADHLTNGHDTCPLLLDDITVHADAARTRDILDLLFELSKERQIVLFTQEEQVAAWANEHLTAARDRVVDLDAPVAA